MVWRGQISSTWNRTEISGEFLVPTCTTIWGDVTCHVMRWSNFFLSSLFVNQHSAPLHPSTILARPCQAAPFHDFLSTKAWAFVKSSAIWNTIQGTNISPTKALLKMLVSPLEGRNHGLFYSRSINSSTMSMSMNENEGFHKPLLILGPVRELPKSLSIDRSSLHIIDFNVSHFFHWWLSFLSILGITQTSKGF